MTLYSYKAAILNIVDGDTIDLRVDLGFKVQLEHRFRLARINAAEMKDARDDVRAYAVAAKRAIEAMAPAGTKATIKSQKPLSEDKYGRWVADVFLADGSNISDTLLRQGMVKLYPQKY